MLTSIGDADIKRRLSRDNPWWGASDALIPEASLRRRVYLKPFQTLALQSNVRRATVLLGPRRVGKTVMVKQLIAEAIGSGFDPKSILFASVDTPIYAGIALEKFLELIPGDPKAKRLAIFDEIQYLRDWERHVKDLVDAYPDTKIIATGSAAAALRLKSKESGAGRITEFMLPPLTFFEFLQFLDKEEELIMQQERRRFEVKDIEALNEAFLDYLNYGGYPEAVLNDSIRSNPDQFIRNDIIDKVLLKDLPTLYGIDDIPQLNQLFTFLAYNAGQEAGLDRISQQCGLAKATVKKYLEYLESAFLIIKLSNTDENCRSMQRERTFKVFLNNPSMRAALFTPVTAEETRKIGHLAESAIFSQWQHSNAFKRLRYARWKNEGEVDIVFLSPGEERPLWLGEIKWSDNLDVKNIRHLMGRHNQVQSAFITTKTVSRTFAPDANGVVITAIPSALHCYRIGRNITESLDIHHALGEITQANQGQLFQD